MTEPHPVQRDVAAFHEALELTIGETPAIRDADLRASLILEEAAETAESLTGRKVECSLGVSDSARRERSLAGAIDGLCDLLAVVYGAAVTFGIDLAPFWEEVHRTNMAKVGGPKRADGKQLKPEGWTPPDIEGLLAELYPDVCRKCGCTAERACWHMDFGGCGWAEPGLCTACHPDAGPGWEHPDLDFGPREDEGGEGASPDDPPDGAGIERQATPSEKGGAPSTARAAVDQAPDAGDQEGADSSRIGRPST